MKWFKAPTLLLLMNCLGGCTADLKISETVDPVKAQQDLDSDGFNQSTDCDDSNPEINPNAEEICDGIDNNCDGLIDENLLEVFYLDEDGDGFGDAADPFEACEPLPHLVENDTDCDDNDAQTYPNAVEICNDKDNNCDGIPDDSPEMEWFADGDQDGFGNPALPMICDENNPVVSNSKDCNDDDDAIHPNASEICDERDNNCNGEWDEGVENTYYLDNDRDGYGNPNESFNACAAPEGYVAWASDCDDFNTEINPDAAEVCDYIDNNCNGIADESGSSVLWYLDNDGDGFGDPNTFSDACTQPPNHIENDQDCNDADNAVNPNAIEICDGQDTDCNGVTDDAATDIIWYRDNDQDNFGNEMETLFQCEQPLGYVLIPGDCNDDNANIYPSATEICNGEDDDCDNAIDEGLMIPTWYEDQDNDGFGNATVSIQGCEMPTGYSDNGNDCNDNEDWIYPGAQELCNSLDDDCNGQIDEGLSTSNWFADMDMDGFGDPLQIVNACMAPTNHVSNNDDCDDSRIDVNPNQPEICNGLDDDCDGTIDVGVISLNQYYADNDGDGFGSPSVFIEACIMPQGYSTTDDDCDDSNPTIYPEADEFCDGIDSNCDGSIGFWESDLDNDGFRACEKALWIQNSLDSNPSPFNSYFQVSEMLRVDHNIEWDIIDSYNSQITPILLENYGLIIHYGNNQHYGQMAVYDSSESVAIENFIANGGRLLYIGWHGNNYGCSAIDSMPHVLGVSCGNQWSSWSGNTNQFANHPITNGLNGYIGGLGGDYWHVSSPAETLASIWDNMNFPFIIASEWGNGKAVFVADEWPFYNDSFGGTYHLGYSENQELVQNIFSWVAGP